MVLLNTVCVAVIFTIEKKKKENGKCGNPYPHPGRLLGLTGRGNSSLKQSDRGFGPAHYPAETHSVTAFGQKHYRQY